MERRIVRAAVISTDAAFREELAGMLAAPERGIAIAVAIAAPFREISEEHLEELRTVNPELIVLDLEEDPEIGIRLAQFLAEANPLRRFLAVGPSLPPELLLAPMRVAIPGNRPRPAPA